MDAAEEAIKDMAERVAESALEGRSLGSASFFNLMLSSAKKGAAMTPVTDVAQREPVLLCPGAGDGHNITPTDEIRSRA